MRKEQRRRIRIELALPAWIYIENKRFSTETKNLSLKGVLLNLKHGRVKLIKGEKYKIIISPGGGVEIKVISKFVDQTQRGASFDFIKMDEVSFRNLFNIIRLYAPDPDLVKEELTNPAFDVKDLDL